ncbi:kinase-like domain-containing protein [Infundibulicybe gibba]|nr:kinase-like domain-containing protein [Infundibulicybe gibba]
MVPDLTTIAGVFAYLSSTPFCCDDKTQITSLSGGHANFTYRVHMSTPFEGQSTVVLKHARRYMKNLVTVPFDLSRQVYEVEALRRIRAWLPPDSIVTVPRVYLFDAEFNAIFMEDCGNTSQTLKEFIQSGRLSVEMAQTMGTALGLFIGKVHSWSQENPDMAIFFAGNEQARAISEWTTYQRLLTTLKGDENLPALEEPRFRIPQKQFDIIKGSVDQRTPVMKAAREIFVMGDFWPGNMMVTLNKDNGSLKNIFILDWELSKTGLPGIELGVFCAEIHLLRRFVPVYEDTISIMLTRFLQAYRVVGSVGPSLARETLIHWGGHLIVFTPWFWEGKEKVREVVTEGISILIGALTENERWLRKSFVKSLA